MATYELLKQEGSAKRAVFHTVHGDIQTQIGRASCRERV